MAYETIVAGQPVQARAEAGRSIYKCGREKAGFTQERAAERLHISDRLLRRYESGEIRPPDDIVYNMVEIYNDQRLAVEHLRQSSRVAADLIPPVEDLPLQTVAIRAFNDIADILADQPERKLLRIAEDGVISADERPVLDEVMAVFSRLAKLYTELRIAAERTNQ